MLFPELNWLQISFDLACYDLRVSVISASLVGALAGLAGKWWPRADGAVNLSASRVGFCLAFDCLHLVRSLSPLKHCDSLTAVLTESCSETQIERVFSLHVQFMAL